VATALAKVTDDIDVIVSDLGLPDGSGFELVQQLSAERPVRAIALSGYGTARDVEHSRQAGFARHLTKPVDPDALVRAIEEVAVGATALRSGARPTARASRRR